jgi:signal transduction histidine kinase
MHFIPVTQKVGPDGALYVSDWSDQQICHRGSGAVEHWDRSNGRIYRVTYEGGVGVQALADSGASQTSAKASTPTAPFDLVKESDENLAKLAVQSENEWFSRMARRVMADKWTLDSGLPSSPKPVGDIDWLRSAWLLKTLLTASGDTLLARFGNIQPPSPASNFPANVRAQLVRFSDLGLSGPTSLETLASGDPSPIVRRELASALQRLPIDQRQPLATALLKHGEDAEDPMIPLLIWYGIEPVVAADAAVGLQLAKVSKIPKVTEFIYRRLAGEEAGIQGLLKLAAESKDAALRQNLLTAVLQAARGGSKVSQPANWPAMREKVASALAESGDAAQAATTLLLELEAHMGIEVALKHFRDQLALATAGTAARESALKVLLQAKDAATAKILLNIVSNAIKFTDAGGRVDITVRAETDAQDLSTFTIRVEDTGIGMTPQDLEKSLQMFGQADSGLNRKYEGTGLGLPLTKKLVELHKAEFNITSQPKIGTVVTLRFFADPSLLK